MIYRKSPRAENRTIFTRKMVQNVALGYRSLWSWRHSLWGGLTGDREGLHWVGFVMVWITSRGIWGGRMGGESRRKRKRTGWLKLKFLKGERWCNACVNWMKKHKNGRRYVDGGLCVHVDRGQSTEIKKMGTDKRLKKTTVISGIRMLWIERKERK